MEKSIVRPAGNLAYKVQRAQRAPLSWRLRNVLRWQFIQGWMGYHIARTLGKMFSFGTIISKLSVRVRRASGEWIDYGVVSYKVVTTAFITDLATALHTQASPGNFFYHALGTGSTAAAVTDTGMGTELTTEYNPDGTRATGTHTSSAGVYTSVATNTIDAGTPAVTEHGVMGAATGASTLVDRHVFTAVNMAAGDSFQSTYTLTFTAGG